jgi:trimeric autotransporter adhesin
MTLKTGSIERGGRPLWRIVSVMVLGMFCSALEAATFTVTSTADTGGNCNATPTNCTLRQAINSANSDVLSDTIAFNIPPAGTITITPASALPIITRGVFIDGYSQPGAIANTSATGFNAVIKIRLSGSSIPTEVGLRAQPTVGAVTVAGLAITDFNASAIGVFGAAIEASGSSAVSVRGCAIGLAPNFTVAGNQQGIRIAAGQSGAVTIGSTGSATTIQAARNLISGNTLAGVVAISGSGSVSVFNNLIGTNAAGSGQLGSQNSGITTQRPGTVIRNNVLRGNGIGISLQAPDFDVTGNSIFFTSGTGSGVGIKIQGNASGQGVIGGPGALFNKINTLTADGIEHSAANMNVDLAFNSIGSGGGQRPIDLLGIDGLDPNDPGDPDVGPNGLMNHPIITSARRFADVVNAPITVSGTLNSLPNRNFRIVFYVSSFGTIGDSTTTVTTDANGDGSFGPLDVIFPDTPVTQIGATATLVDTASGTRIATGEYSVFAGVETVAPPVALVVNSAADPGDGICDATECTLREAIVAANDNNNPQSIDLISFNIPGAPEQAHVIQLLSSLPRITEPAILDGYTQPGADPNTDATGVGSNADLKIELAGGNFFAFDGALDTSVTLRGLSFTGFMSPIHLAGTTLNAPNSHIEGCWYGVRPDGTEVLTRMFVALVNDSNVFGGDSPAQRNVFVSQFELGLSKGRATNNLFGVLPDGRTAATVSVTQAPSASALNAASSNPTIIDKNIFASSNPFPAIIARNTQIIDNAFGESWDGTSTFALHTAIQASIDTVIRSSTHHIRNAVSDAIVIDSSNLSGSILIDQPIVGGQGKGVNHFFSSHVSIRSSISATTGIGIDLVGGIEDAFGVTANDIHPTLGPDADAGPNGLQNFPELIAAFRGANTISVSGTLKSLPNQQYRILICGSASSHASGHGGCDEVLDDQTIISADALGFADFNISVPDRPGYAFVTATAALITTPDSDEQTSEYALSIPITAETALFGDGFE